MQFWKPAIVGAALAVAACQPVGMPLGEQRLAEKIAEEIFTDAMLGDFMRQQVEGMLYQGAVSQDQVTQVAIAVSRDLEAKLPEVRKTLVAGLTREFNVKELQFLHKLLTSDEARNVMGKQEAAMSEATAQLTGFAQEAAAKAVEKINAAWPTGPNPPPATPPGLPPGMVMPN